MGAATAGPEPSICKRRRIGLLEACLVLSMIALLSQLFPDIRRAWREWPTPGRQTPGHVVIESPNARYEIPYLIYLPSDYASRQRWPLLLYLHGAGTRGDDLGRVRKCGPSLHIAHQGHLPMIVLSPQCPKDQYWDSQQLLALLDQIESKFSVDRDRVYVAGFSMGGSGTWELATAAPDRFAGIVPVAGGWPVESASALKSLPIWAFHGEEDKTVSVEGSTKIVEAIKQAGGKPKLTIFPKTGHGIDKQVFSRTDVYDWLLRQKRRAVN
jgi:predicted peptidase